MIFVSKPQADHFAQNYLKYAPGFRQLITRDATDLFRFGGKMEKDLIWLEWANDPTAAITCHRWNAPVMVRVHDHEIYKGQIQKVHWQNVDIIWFINRQSQTDFNKIMGNKVKHCQQFFLPNAVDPQPFVRSLTDNKHIGMLSIHFRPRKRFDRAIEVMKYINEVDPDWKLTIRADPNSQDYIRAEYDECVKLVKESGVNVEFDTRHLDRMSYGTEKKDVNEFFKDKSVVMSTSEHEGFHYTIAEGALCGCVPVVYNWEWGEPNDFWWPHTYNSEKVMAGNILRSGAMNMLEEMGNSARRFVMEKYHPQFLLDELAFLLGINDELFYGGEVG